MKKLSFLFVALLLSACGSKTSTESTNLSENTENVAAENTEKNLDFLWDGIWRSEKSPNNRMVIASYGEGDEKKTFAAFFEGIKQKERAEYRISGNMINFDVLDENGKKTSSFSWEADEEQTDANKITVTVNGEKQTWLQINIKQAEAGSERSFFGIWDLDVEHQNGKITYDEKYFDDPAKYPLYARYNDPNGAGGLFAPQLYIRNENECVGEKGYYIADNYKQWGACLQIYTDSDKKHWAFLVKKGKSENKELKRAVLDYVLVHEQNKMYVVSESDTLKSLKIYKKQ